MSALCRGINMEILQEKKDIKSMSLAELTEELTKAGEKRFRAVQVFEWLHAKQVKTFDEMTNLSAALRETLAKQYYCEQLKPVEMLVSKLDGTRKFLFALADGNVVESVFMKYKHGNSVCISSQAGCRMGCRFCASTLGGLVRNLRPSEMLEQIYRIAEITGEQISNIVVMGTGEPLDNYDHLLRFLSLINDEKGLHISHRNITVSTCGLVPEIYKLAEEKLQITLALSLHASTQEKRLMLMPVANRYELTETLNACKDYFAKTGRRISFEYALVGGANDTSEDAQALSQLLKGFPCHVNLIPVNPVKERDFVQPERARIEGFKNILERNKINVTIRREMGRDINGACGQLRRSHMTV